MSKNEENNSHLIVKNNSIQNLNVQNHNKNKSSNFLTDSPSTLISVQLHSINSNKNSKNKDQEKNNLSIKNNNTNQIRNKKESNDSLKDLNNIRIKLSKISSQYSANTPKQIAHIYNQLCNTKVDPGNIVVKKNLKLGSDEQRKASEQYPYKSHRNKKENDFVQYVNNDKHNFKENFLNLTQNCSKYILSQSKSFVNINKKNSKTNLNKSNNNRSHNNTNVKKGNKKMELSGLAKSSNNLYQNYYSKNNNEINYIYNNKKTEGNIHSKNKMIISDDNTKNKKIYLMKPVYKRKKSYENNNNKSIENSNINTNQSSICSKNNKNICDDNIINDFFNNKIENPEELHFFYVKILQNSHEISKRFEND